MRSSNLRSTNTSAKRGCSLRVGARQPRVWQRCLGLGVLVASVAGARLARVRFGPLATLAEHHLPTLCPFRLLTGRACPTCGLGRSLLACWSGDLALGLRHHPAGPAVLVAAAALALAYAVRPRAAMVAVRRVAVALAARPTLVTGMVVLYSAWGFLR